MQASQSNFFDAIVAGAGPAGSTCALFLARAGLKVLLLDKAKFPRDKVCADNKTWLCTSILRELGLWQKFLKLPKQEVHSLVFTTPGREKIIVELDSGKMRSHGPHYNVRRTVFDNFLFQAAKKQGNVKAIEGFWIKKVLQNEQNFVVGVEGIDSRGYPTKFFAKVVVAADGSESAVAASAGINPIVPGRHALSARAYYSGVECHSRAVELHYLKGVAPGYFWIFPVDRGWCNVGVGLPAAAAAERKIDLSKLLEQIIRSPEFSPRFNKARKVSATGVWGVTIILKRRPCCGNGLLLAGDAANTAVAFGGEGVGPAMRSAKMAAAAVEKAFSAGDFSHEFFKKHYEGELWKIRSRENRGASALEFLTTHPKVFDFVVRRASRHEKLLQLASEITSDYANAAKIISPRTIARLLVG